MLDTINFSSIFPDTFLSWKKYPKTAFLILQGTFYVPFHSTKTADKCWTTCFFPYLYISLRGGTHFRSIYRLVLCKIEVIASKFEILDLFLNFKLTNLRTGFNSYQYVNLKRKNFFKSHYLLLSPQVLSLIRVFSKMEFII